MSHERTELGEISVLVGKKAGETVLAAVRRRLAAERAARESAEEKLESALRHLRALSEPPGEEPG